jgi:nitrite transporter NirC
MFDDTVEKLAGVGDTKARWLKSNPGAFFITSMMAGAYVGIGIILIFSLGSLLDSSVRPLVMGASFGIALILVVFAGSDLFTGHTMTATLALLRKKATAADLLSVWTFCWLGNLVGALALAAIFVGGGGGSILSAKSELIFNVAGAKMNAPALQLFCRAILCNWCVCLALWMSNRMTSDAAKCIAIAWCLMAFIGAGFEHSIANMTIFGIALFAPHPDTVSWGGFAWNMVWVTLGNVVSGAVFMAAAYWYASRPAKQATEPVRVLVAAE